MTVHEDLPTQYHQQDTDYYCGAACAQMVLQQCGVGLLGQAGLYSDNNSHSTTETGWYTGPDGLTWTLNNRQSSKYFVLDALNTEDAISRMIAWTIHHYRVSPVAMVFGSAHWVVVRGYTASAEPGSSGDVGYTISGFDINNPDPQNPNCDDATAPPVTGRVIKTEIQQNDTIITVAAGSDQGVSKTWKGHVLRGDSGSPMDGGEVTVIRVGKRETIGKVHLTTDQISAFLISERLSLIGRLQRQAGRRPRIGKSESGVQLDGLQKQR